MWWILPSDPGIRNVSHRCDNATAGQLVPFTTVNVACTSSPSTVNSRSVVAAMMRYCGPRPAAPQVISGGAGLDALLDADAVRREGHGIAVGRRRIDIGIGRRDAVGF
jgi:hypothetical protein